MSGILIGNKCVTFTQLNDNSGRMNGIIKNLFNNQFISHKSVEIVYLRASSKPLR